MGAEIFYNERSGMSPMEAFKEAVEDARYMVGHQGYSGTIAEKGDYQMSKKPTKFTSDEWIEMVEDFDFDDKDNEHYFALKADYKIYDDKWGPALCIDCGDGDYVFCGWASS